MRVIAILSLIVVRKAELVSIWDITKTLRLLNNGTVDIVDQIPLCCWGDVAL